MKYLLFILPTEFKIWLLNLLYKDIAAMGDGGDTELAHINAEEAKVLLSMGGSGTINKKTGLKEFIGGGSSGGSSGPTQSTVYQQSIPPELLPITESTLGAAAQQVYNTDASGNITGIKPYQPYSTDPSQYVAGFSPMQQQSYTGAGQLTTPGQFQAGSQLAGAAGLGSLGVAGQAAQAGNQYNQMATNPYVTQAFMNPYVSSSLAPQLAEIQRQGDIASTQAASQATGSGAFGGTRSALAQNEAQRNAMMAQQNAIGQGYNTAFNQAQQAQQFGANLGLQGQQTALSGLGQAGQAGATLGQLGTQQLGAQQGILGLQNQFGAQQQQQQQNITNQAIQNYATGQQYPLMQLGTMMDLIRGTPIQTSSTQSYQAAPNPISQLAGLGTAGIAGLGLYNTMGGGSSSDIRVKENIELVDVLVDGINIYEFDYKPEFKDKAGHGRYRGVMADEVEQIMPNAVGRDSDGYKTVHYSMLGIKMEEV